MHAVFTTRRLALLTLGVCSTTLFACSEAPTASADGSSRHIGVLQLEPARLAAAALGGDTSNVSWNNPPGAGTITAPKVIEVADTVRVGQPVSIVVNTVLLSGCWRTGGEEVKQSGLVVDITPEDENSGAPICTMIYGWGAHRVTATFATAGTATIRVTGRRIREGDTTTSEPLTAERTIVVR